MNRLGIADNLRKTNARITGAFSALSEHISEAGAASRHVTTKTITAYWSKQKLTC